jgi:hypothetical protein
MRRSAGVRRRRHAGRETSKNWGGPIGVWPEGKTAAGSTAPKARQGKPGPRTLLAPQRPYALCTGQAEESGERESPPDAEGESSHA